MNYTWTYTNINTTRIGKSMVAKGAIITDDLIYTHLLREIYKREEHYYTYTSYFL